MRVPSTNALCAVYALPSARPRSGLGWGRPGRLLLPTVVLGIRLARYHCWEHAGRETSFERSLDMVKHAFTRTSLTLIATLALVGTSTVGAQAAATGKV